MIKSQLTSEQTSNTSEQEQTGLTRKRNNAQSVSYIELLLSHSPYYANGLIALEISADELTPLAYSKARLFKPASYGLFVEICEDSILFTIRKFSKRKNGESGYFDIIEQDNENFEVFYFNSWAIYASE